MRQSASRAVREPKNTRRSSFGEMQARIDALEAEVDAAREREVATAEILQVINSSPGDLAPVFEAILEKAHNLCGVAHGSLHLAGDGAFHTVAMRGIPEAFAEIVRRPSRPGPNHPVRQLVAGAPFA